MPDLAAPTVQLVPRRETDTTRTVAYGQRLTSRELQVLHGIMAGQENIDISRDLCLSDHTVKTHVRRLFKKLGVNNRTAAAVVALTNGLAKPRITTRLPDSMFSAAQLREREERRAALAHLRKPIAVASA